MAGGSKLSPFGHAIAGTGGAMFALTCTYPLDIIKTRMQVRSKSSANTSDPDVYQSTTDAVQKILKSEGLPGLYAGLFSGLLGTASQNFAYFYWYTFIRSGYISRQPAGAALSTIMELLIGAGAGALAQIFTIPVAVVTTRQQTMPLGERQDLKSTTMEIVREEGWTGLWKGLKPSLVLVINPAITYGMFSRIQELVLKAFKRKDMTPGLVFLVGALAKTLATVVTYPYIMAKVRLQWKPSKKDAKTHKPYTGAIDVLQRVFEKEGLKGWYTGMQAQITKAVISQALLFLVKDQLEKYTILLFALLSKQKRAKVM
ncbi:ADP/ATP carrier protein [Haplosporangium sp. Z 767]|nr:ADP/ATP carrier protein [Haplosporangium sp. Z 767]KAF9188463.1 ADP/ATP carrier protein [Haplosporangium sp. Z 11]